MSTVTLERAQRFTMTAAKTDRTFDIAWAAPLPLGGTNQMPQDCPILIVLDSSLTFGTALERSSLYSAMGGLQSAVVVGVGYPGNIFASLTARTVDFTPETPAGTHADMAPMIGTEFGGADDFLAFLLDELAPAIRERCSQASASRVILHGFSLGGLFSAYALTQRPEAFEAFSIVAPSLWWNDFAVMKLLPDLARRLEASGKRPHVLLAVGALEQDMPTYAPPGLDLDELCATVARARMVDGARDFRDALRELPIGELDYVEFKGEDHAGALTAGTGRMVGFTLRHRAA